MKYFEKLAVSGEMVSKAITSRLKTTKGLSSIVNTQNQIRRMGGGKLGYPQTLSKGYDKYKALTEGMTAASVKWGKTYDKIKKWL